MKTISPCTWGEIVQNVRMSQAINPAQRRTLKTQLAARQDELRTCITPAQVSCVLREIERIQALLQSGRWPA